jgi:CcmD family protein
MKMENRRLKIVWSLLAMLVLPMVTFAQGVDMADTMRSEGKIFVVVGVIAIIFVGIAIYLISLDRRISKMENQKGKN